MKPKVLWSPHSSDTFITYSSEICLYKTFYSGKDNASKGETAKNQVIAMSDDCSAYLLSVVNDVQLLKCVAWYPYSEPDDLLAIGQSNGKVIVTRFMNERVQSNYALRREFVPRHPRPCNGLAWNPVANNLLAAGLDKQRNDVSLLVWDINVQLTVRDISGQEKQSRHATAVSGKQSPIMGYGVPDTSTSGHRPLAELSTSEPTISLAWFPHDPNSLIAGQGTKFLRVYDMRDKSQPHSAAVTKAVCGVAVDSHIENRVASFSECQQGVVCIWDIRNFEKPMITLTHQSPIRSIAWSSTRFGLLSTLTRDSSVVQLYDIQHAQWGSSGYDSYELDAAVIERTAKGFSSGISSFSWHPSDKNRMLTISPTGTLSDLTIFERISMMWCPSSHLTFGCGEHLLECIPNKIKEEEDISFIMKKRALAGYGIELFQPDEISKMINDSRLLKLWKWFHQAKKLAEKGNRRKVHFFGVKSVINGEKIPGNVLTSSKTMTELSRQDQRVRSITYVNDERKMALSLCGWNFSNGSGPLRDFLKRLQDNGLYERAAAIALFNNDIRQAIEILSSASKSVTYESSNQSSVSSTTLNMIAMALSGYTPEKTALWREMCRNLSTEISSPYLRAAFVFLTSEDDNFDCILQEPRIEVEDRVAFACKFLPDSKLTSFINSLTAKMINDGNLDGILLTGISKECVDLLENYVNKTTDIQTASLLIVNSIPNIPNDVVNDLRVKTWIDSYRNLLDMWRLWHKRAQFDIHHTLRDISRKPVQQVFVTCNFCGNSIQSSSGAPDSRPRKYAQYSNPANKPKVMGCPGCRKPLPRCSLCLVNMGTPSTQPQKNLNIDASSDKPKNVRSINPFSSWFTWCQSCRHGGHAHHIVDWFREHSECPVTACGCHCMKLDSVAMATPAEVTTS